MGPYEPDPTAMINPSPIFGLELEINAIYGCVRTGSGEIYELLRAIRAVNPEEAAHDSAIGGFSTLR